MVGLACTALCALASAAPGWTKPVEVERPGTPMPINPVTVSFKPRGRLPKGGYYYSVLVLEDYRPAGPQCAISSDMTRTDYGYPHRRHSVKLTLLPAPSALHEWCYEGIYDGAVYAVPHRPPCSHTRPCYAGITCGTHTVCGVVAPPLPYSYPGGLPKPIDSRSRIVAHFRLSFPFTAAEQIESVPVRAKLLAEALTTAKRNGDEHPTDIEAVRTTHARAQRLLNEDVSPPSPDTPVYLLAMRGRFVCDSCSVPRGAKAPSGTVIVLELPVSGGGFGFSIGHRYPELERAGVPMRLD
jgi:hypothetical protein